MWYAHVPDPIAHTRAIRCAGLTARLESSRAQVYQCNVPQNGNASGGGGPGPSDGQVLCAGMPSEKYCDCRADGDCINNNGFCGCDEAKAASCCNA